MNKTEVLTNSAAAFIHETFVMSISQANQHARGYVDLVDAKGGDTESFSLAQLQEIIIKGLGNEYQWRDEQKRQQVLKERQSRVDDYDAYIESGKKSPFKKW